MNPCFAADHLADEAACVENLLSSLEWNDVRAKRIRQQAERLIHGIHGHSDALGDIDAFLGHYPLDTPEGLALMSLAEALLRISDADTADALIAEKLGTASWKAEEGGGMMRLADAGINLARKMLRTSPGRFERSLIRKSMEEAVRRIGHQFVLGENMADALSAGKKLEHRGYGISYDMLGEGARTAADAQRYFEAYADGVDALGKSKHSPREKGISVKLSALHPRYTWNQKDKCVPEIARRLTELCIRAAESNISLTVDAEEADRLEISWEIISMVGALPELRGWNGFGLAIQAYDKRCFRLIEDIGRLAANTSRKLCVRLVKGAYWDTEIKRAQVLGLADYPVFTRKANTDLSYLAGAQKLLGLRRLVYPMFGTHNAYTIAAILDMAGNSGGFEFQRLHGMGDALYEQVLGEYKIPVTAYAPVGNYEELLPYLIRRLLENGANTSFVRQVRGGSVENVLRDPVEEAGQAQSKRNLRIPLPSNLYGVERANSAGPDLSAETMRTGFLERIPSRNTWRNMAVLPIINGRVADREATTQGLRSHPSPGNRNEIITRIGEASADNLEDAFLAARQGIHEWSRVPSFQRAEVLRGVANLIQDEMPRFVGLLQFEGGKTLQDAISEVRETIDFCRYYAMQGERLFDERGVALPGPTGEENRVVMEARGIFLCISPWNFPLSIFMGQIVAALMAGNSVIAKPAEQTPLIAFEAIRALLDAGVPPAAVTLLPGGGETGAKLVEHPDVSGIVFTGSVEVGHLINRALAAKDGPIVPLIAETGGQNAMIVDSSALPEQVIDDVLLSAFGSAGQRCSALRVLYLQEEISARILELLRGAMLELRIGDPSRFSTDIGPVIDADAFHSLSRHLRNLKEYGALIGQAPLPEGLDGWYIAPAAYEIDSIFRLPGEVFGPILHVIRYEAKNLARVIDDINATGFGLTFGMHSRLQHRTTQVAGQINAGNVYINRSMIGAVVGVQPFGGHGLSGTGPKAGGPYYLQRFANEKAIAVNTAAIGGNIALLNAGAE
ncbi:MAG TPA: bifunctional proline dehydrogenase/L-glutamate gamma-semialdehyde dehydrogenase PutA [Nitrosospira sp.]|nr:bifunctional proline dehydrogenase/L-glutamate gamma-semialdehyde dehydrogenase PutA [Nitrosospira sp.]